MKYLRFSFFEWVFVLYVLISFVVSYNLPLTEQESYYWLWAKNLDWGYFDHPPLQAWVTALLSYFLGDEKWVIRLPALFGNVATLALFYSWIRERYGKSLAELSTLLLASSCVFVMGAVIAIPDSLAVPLGLLTIYFCEKGDSRKAGITFGFALLAKWTVLFIGPGILYAFYRRKDFSFKTYLNLFLIPLLLQSPVIWWNIEHGAASLRFHLYERHAHTLLSLPVYLSNFLQFILAQFFVLGLVTCALIFLLLRRRKTGQLEKEQAIHWASILFWCLPGLAVVLISAVQGQLRFYWTFLSLIPAFAVVGYLIYFNYPKKLKLIRAVAVVFISLNWVLAVTTGFYPVGKIFESTLNLKPDPRNSPMGEYYGWRQWFDNDIVTSNLIDPQTAFVGSDLHVASRLSWALRKDSDLKTIGVVGKHRNQFEFWPQPEPPRFTKAIFFADNRYDRIANFDGQCLDDVDWKTSPIQVRGETVKEIYWAYCKSWKPTQ